METEENPHELANQQQFCSARQRLHLDGLRLMISALKNFMTGRERSEETNLSTSAASHQLPVTLRAPLLTVLNSGSY